MFCNSFLKSFSQEQYDPKQFSVALNKLKGALVEIKSKSVSETKEYVGLISASVKEKRYTEAKNYLILTFKNQNTVDLCNALHQYIIFLHGGKNTKYDTLSEYMKGIICTLKYMENIYIFDQYEDIKRINHQLNLRFRRFEKNLYEISNMPEHNKNLMGPIDENLIETHLDDLIALYKPK